MANWLTTEFDNTLWTERRAYAVFVAKSGHDGANNDGSPRRPFLTIAKAVSVANTRNNLSGISGDTMRYVVVGEGIYIGESFPLLNIHIMGDSGARVVFNGNGATSLENSVSGVSPFTFMLTNITAMSYVGLTGAGTVPGIRLFATFTNVKLFNIGRLNDVQNNNTKLEYTFSYCEINNCFQQQVNGSGAFNSSMYFDHCTVNGSYLKTYSSGGTGFFANFILRSSIVDAASAIGFQTGGSWTLLNNNIQCSGIVIGSSTYTNIAQAQAANPSVIANNTSVSPGFVNPSSGDYSLMLNSPLRYSAADDSFIGALGPGIRQSGTTAYDILTNTQWNATTSQFELVDPTQRGTIEFKVIDYGGPQTIAAITLEGSEDISDHQTLDTSLSYDNTNGVPNDFGQGPFGSGQYGFTYWVKDYNSVTYNGIAYPKDSFLVVNSAASNQQPVFSGSGQLVRITEIPNIRTVELKYTLGNLASLDTAVFKHFIYGKQPTVDANGNSNGNPAYNPLTAAPLAVAFSKARVTILPNSIA
jgi:hypothetical protein